MSGHKDNLKAGIATMKNFLSRVVPWVEKSIHTYGRRTSRDQHTGWTDSEYMLAEFEAEYGFRFEMSRSGMASCSTSVFKRGREVLKIEYEGDFNVGHCKVAIFERKDSWTIELMSFINAFESILHRLDSAKTAELRERVKVREREEENAKLSHEAERLKVS